MARIDQPASGARPISAQRQNQLDWAPIVCALAAVVIAVSLAFVISGYRLFQLTMVGIYGLAILGLNIVTGFNGQISLGHGAFFAIGAYTTAALMSGFGVPFWVSLPVAAAVCGGFGFLIGFPALRFGGLHLALTTFALAVAVPQLLKFKLLERWTGGSQGIVLTRPDPPFGLPLAPDQFMYLLTVLVTSLMFLLAWNLLGSRIGRNMRAVRDNDLAAEAMGINLALLKTRTFAVSAIYTGIAGSLSAIAVEFVSPDSFTIFLSIFLFVGMVIGGANSIVGALFGAAFIVFVPNIAEQISKAAPGAIYGAVLIAVLFVMPSGVAGGLRWIRLKLTNKRNVAP